jgi:hypothetical protein
MISCIMRVPLSARRPRPARIPGAHAARVGVHVRDGRGTLLAAAIGAAPRCAGPAAPGSGQCTHARSCLLGHRRTRRVRSRVEVLDESRACGCPAEKLPCHSASRREIHAEGADPPEMTLDVIRGDRCNGQAEGAADGLRDVAGRYADFRDGVQASAGRSLRESKSDEVRGSVPGAEPHCHMDRSAALSRDQRRPSDAPAHSKLICYRRMKRSLYRSRNSYSAIRALQPRRAMLSGRSPMTGDGKGLSSHANDGMTMRSSNARYSA